MPLCMQKPNIEMTERILAFDLDFELYSRDIEKSFKHMLVNSGCIFMKDPILAFAWLKLGVQVLLANSMKLRTTSFIDIGWVVNEFMAMKGSKKIVWIVSFKREH